MHRSILPESRPGGGSGPRPAPPGPRPGGGPRGGPGRVGRAFCGPEVELPARRGLHRPLVPHLVPEPFSTYPYALARLTALRLRRAPREDPARFRGRFADFLGRGGAAPPLDQLADLDVGVGGAGDWQDGLARLAAPPLEGTG